MNFFNAYPSTLNVDRVIRVPGDFKAPLCRINVWTDRAASTYPLLLKYCLPDSASSPTASTTVPVTVCEPLTTRAAPISKYQVQDRINRYMSTFNAKRYTLCSSMLNLHPLCQIECRLI
jgi:hypothetical protein